MRRVLVTGSAGRIGRHLCKSFAGLYEIRGFDRQPNEDLDDQVIADIGDLDAVRRACDGVSAVIHLAGNGSRHAPWDAVLSANIVGTYTVFEAARQTGVEKVVFASSCQVTFGYGEHGRQDPDRVPKPISMYGVSKVTGEMIAHAYAVSHAIDVICIRIGLFSPSGRLSAGRTITGRFLGLKDTAELFRRAVDVIGVRYAVVYGYSKSSRNTHDPERARAILGYIPEESEDELWDGAPSDGNQ